MWTFFEIVLHCLIERSFTCRDMEQKLIINKLNDLKQIFKIVDPFDRHFYHDLILVDSVSRKTLCTYSLLMLTTRFLSTYKKFLRRETSQWVTYHYPGLLSILQWIHGWSRTGTGQFISLTLIRIVINIVKLSLWNRQFRFLFKFWHRINFKKK